LLGLRPRDEHARTDGQLQRSERRRTEQVLQRHPGRPGGHKIVEPGLLDGRERRGERQPAAPDTEDMGSQKFRVDAGRGDAGP
jgi:hypothetical protein